MIQPSLAALPRDAIVLDLGCGQGRLAIRLAQAVPEGRVTGCDVSAEAVAAAARHALGDGVSNVEFTAQSISDCLGGLASASVHAVIMTEVTFFHPDWRRDLGEAVRVLKPGGLAFVSFRPQYFFALLLVRARRWDEIETVLTARQGRILGGTTTFTWQAADEIRGVLGTELGLERVELTGIGACSGIAGDPHDGVCRPSTLAESERRQLMALELALGRQLPDAGRYILTTGRKPLRTK